MSSLDVVLESSKKFRIIMDLSHPAGKCQRRLPHQNFTLKFCSADEVIYDRNLFQTSFTIAFLALFACIGIEQTIPRNLVLRYCRERCNCQFARLTNGARREKYFAGSTSARRARFTPVHIPGRIACKAPVIHMQLAKVLVRRAKSQPWQHSPFSFWGAKAAATLQISLEKIPKAGSWKSLSFLTCIRSAVPVSDL